ncbi:hypothetical protein ACQ4LE_006654 [Meloidogyne hapla]|uniref:Uncharacterized protein n=1 Tax=Meloidogyne hapla TaxID=6305 RepID=A0A1I8BHU0_MELHA
MSLQKQLFLFVFLLPILFSLIEGVNDNKNKNETKDETTTTITTKVTQITTGGYDDKETADYGALAAELAELADEENKLNKKKEDLSSVDLKKEDLKSENPSNLKDKSINYVGGNKGEFEKGTVNKYGDDNFKEDVKLDEEDDSGLSTESSSSEGGKNSDEDNWAGLQGTKPHNEGWPRRRIEKEEDKKEVDKEDEEEDEEEEREQNPKHDYPKHDEGRKKRKYKNNRKDESDEDLDDQIPKSLRKLLKQLAANGKNPLIIPLIINNNNILPNGREEDDDEEEGYKRGKHGKHEGRNERLGKPPLDWYNPHNFQSPFFPPPMFPPQMFPPIFPQQQPPQLGSSFGVSGPLGGQQQFGLNQLGGVPPSGNPPTFTNPFGPPNQFGPPPTQQNGPFGQPNQIPYLNNKINQPSHFGPPNQFPPSPQQQPNQINPQGINGDGALKKTN